MRPKPNPFALAVVRDPIERFVWWVTSETEEQPHRVDMEENPVTVANLDGSTDEIFFGECDCTDFQKRKLMLIRKGEPAFCKHIFAVWVKTFNRMLVYRMHKGK